MRKLIFFIFLFIILRIPSFFEPHWYGDEGIYAAVALALEKGAVLYRDVFDNRLPFIYYLFALGNSANRLFFVRLANLVFGIFTLIFFYHLLKKIKIKKIFWGVFLLTLLLGLPNLEPNVSHNEVFFLPLTILSLFFLFSKNKKNWFLAGLFFGLAFVVKFQSALTLLALLFYLSFFEKSFKKIFSLLGGFFLTIFLLFTFFIWQGNLGEAINYTFLNNFFYTKIFASYRLPFSFRLFFLFFQLFLLIFLFKKNFLSRHGFLFFLILIFDFWAAIFPGRFYPHYLIQVIPSFSLVSSYLFSQRKNLRLKFLFLTLIIFLNLRIFSLGAGPTSYLNFWDYYGNFFRYLLKKPALQSLPFVFGKEDAMITDLKKNSSLITGRSVFFYADLAWAYDLFRLPPQNFFVTFYHVSLFKNGKELLLKKLKEKKPTVVVVDKKIKLEREIADFFAKEYKTKKITDYFIFYSITP